MFQIDLEEGKRLYITLKAVGEPGEKGYRDVVFEYNGHQRSLRIKDKASTAVWCYLATFSLFYFYQGVVVNRKAVAGELGHVGAPMRGKVLEIKVFEHIPCIIVLYL